MGLFKASAEELRPVDNVDSVRYLDVDLLAAKHLARGRQILLSSIGQHIVNVDHNRHTRSRVILGKRGSGQWTETRIRNALTHHTVIDEEHGDARLCLVNVLDERSTIFKLLLATCRALSDGKRRQAQLTNVEMMIDRPFLQVFLARFLVV